MKPRTAERHIGLEIECVLLKPYTMEAIKLEIARAGLSKFLEIGTDSSVKMYVKPSKQYLVDHAEYRRRADFDFYAHDILERKYPNITGTHKRTWDGVPTLVRMKGYEFRALIPVSEYVKVVPKIMKFILSLGGHVNRTCGLHVHLDMRHEKDLLGSLGRLLQAQDKFMPTLTKNRQRNSYCRRVGMGAKELGEYLANDHDRYVTVNRCSLKELGTIEVRAHEGTLDADTIIGWVSYLWSVVDNRRSSYRLERYVKVKTKKNR